MSTEPTVKHTRSEIRVKNEKAKSTNLMILNNALAQIAAATDPEYRQMRYEGYLRLLECVHVNGVAGAKVQAVEDEQPDHSGFRSWAWYQTQPEGNNGEPYVSCEWQYGDDWLAEQAEYNDWLATVEAASIYNQ